MSWFSSKSRKSTVQSKRATATLEGIRNKLQDYQSTAGKSQFRGPSTVHDLGFFEFEKVAIDPDSSGIFHTPFTC